MDNGKQHVAHTIFQVFPPFFLPFANKALILIRFKTRNTYKRHLKTRHGKVLTTTGELLFLSEEDFQKVRTNRKKKNDVSKDYVIDESVRATKAIMHYQDDNGQLQNILDEDYIVNNDANSSDQNCWESNDAIEMVKGCFETYEVCSESHLDKTEPIQTEIPIDGSVSRKAEDCLSDEYANKAQDDIPLLQSGSCNKLKVVQHENNSTIVNHNSTGPHEIIYHNINKASSYIQVEYNNIINAIGDGNNIEFQENIRHSEDPIKIEEDYFDITSNSSTHERQIKYIHDLKEPETKLIHVDNPVTAENGSTNKHLILTQKDIRHGNKNSDITIIECNSYRGIRAHEILVSEDLINSNSSQEIENEMVSTVADTLFNRNETCTIEEEDRKIGNCRTVVTNLVKNPVVASPNYVLQKDKRPPNQPEQCSYVHNEPLTSIVVENKCINILPQRLKIYSDHQNKSKIQLSKSKKFTLLKNKRMQGINIRQNGNQNTILLLTNDALQNNVFQIDQCQ